MPESPQPKPMHPLESFGADAPQRRFVDGSDPRLGEGAPKRLGFIVMLAGFEATPAEEMPRDFDQTPQRIVKAAPPLPQERAKPTRGYGAKMTSAPANGAVCPLSAKSEGSSTRCGISVIMRLFGAK